VFLIPSRGAVGQRRLAAGVPQDVLGEGGTIVGRVALGADHPDRTVVAAPAQRLGATLTSEAAADDDDRAELILRWAHAGQLGDGE
jgi:hypothetical protein